MAICMYIFVLYFLKYRIWDNNDLVDLYSSLYCAMLN